MATRICRVILSLALSAGLSASADAQLPVKSLSLAVGFGVDTTTSPAGEILALWRSYLTEPSDSLRSRLWSTSERLDATHYDLVAPFVYVGLRHFTVVDLGPARGLPHTFVIRTLVSTVQDSAQDVRPLALYRVYAIEQGGKWVLANAQPRNTREWHRNTIGKITFIYPPTHQFNARLAKASSAFVDSLARAFGLPEPQPITYLFTDDLGETLRGLGLEFFPLAGDTIGGRSNVYARQVYIGSSVNGEGYLHELAHIVLDAEIARSSPHALVEGLMTWTGGSAGQQYGELVPRLAHYLTDHPDLTLERVLSDPPRRVGTLDVGYVGPAVLCKMVFDHAGLPGLRTLLSAGRDPKAILSVAGRVLGVSPETVESLWRKECGLR